MLYVGRPMRAGVYLALTLLVSLGAFLLARQGLWPAGLSFTPPLYLLTVVGIVDAIRIAVQHTTTFTGPWFTTWRGIAAVTVALVALLAGYRMFFATYVTPSGSMLPTLQVNDQFVVSKRAYRDAAPQRGDVVALTVPGLLVIKRVVGLPGDVVVYDPGSRRLTINGVAAGLENLEPNVVRETIGDRSYLVQHEGRSRGGRYEVPDGHYFVLGDNRDNSQDSRYDTFSFVPAANVLGKVTFVYWNTRDPVRAGTAVD